MQPARPPRSKKPEPGTGAAARALRLLARREYTRRELELKLAAHVEDPAELKALLDDFTERGWISESRAADQLVSAKRARFGSARIRHELQQRGVGPELIAGALAGLKESELERARAVQARKFRTAPGDAADCARRVRFLQSRGFSLEVAMRVVRGAGDETGD